MATSVSGTSATCCPANPWEGTGRAGTFCAASGIASRSANANVMAEWRGTAGR